MSFLSEEIASILKWAMPFFVQRINLKKADTPYKLHKLGVNKQDNLMFKTDIKLITSATKVLKKVPTNLHQGLKDSWIIFLKKMVEEIQEESPLGYKLVRVSAPMDPRNMASLDADTHQTMFDAIVGIMHSNKRISGKQGDCAKEQYEQFLQKIVAVNKNELLDFNMKVTRLDDFLAFYVCSSSLYKDFFHGQSSVERRFSVNQQTMAENLEELGLTSLRMVYDEIMYHGGEIKDFSIPTSPLIGCQSAHQKYKSDLDQNDLDLKRGESQKVEVTNKRKLLIEELNIVKIVRL